ncbi:JAB domain-containing protein [Novosphingobium ginsenosidimutans]|uniref:JAB domain-containing protein n=1 Tax=Novosphingobium ginsenosidimutans TaxID=1176536 RepID=UPI0013761F5C|nr:JAB domain-containing protein [Novosphingobium ginsenosidimutans]
MLARLVATFAPADADAIAAQLLATFGSLGQVLSASGSAVREVTGHSELADMILMTKSIVLEAMREDFRQSVFVPDDPKFNQFVIATLGSARQEKMLAIFLDAHSRYIKDEIVAQGGWSEVQLRLRSLLRRAIELDSARIVLCHNHPSGRAEPSKRDIEFTDRLAKCASALGIELVDHLIVAGPRVCSMRTVGAMR